ncbi:MAG: GHMP kinase [Bacteroidales bacterium]|nr:GHMP kinase [Bacteroidales bacterium]
MIISRTPLRISFAGGGSDLPSYYMQHGGAVLSTTIDKYIYIAVHRYFSSSQSLIKYSKTELVNSNDEIEHPLFRECMKLVGVTGLDIASMADVPAGTGLGSSSAFAVSLLNVLHAYKHQAVSAEYLAATACDVEINRLGDPIGKQDQYAAAYGGLNFIRFNYDGSVDVQKIVMDTSVKAQLERNLILLYTGTKHSASAILKEQGKEMKRLEKQQVMHKMVEMAYELKDVLEHGQIDDFGRILNEGWLLKRSLTNNISNPLIDALYDQGMDAGALGGKLLGAGGAGFVLFYCPEERQEEFRAKMSAYTEMPFWFENYGSKIIYMNE